VNELGPRARGLIERVGDRDGPPVGTRDRVRASLGAALGAGAVASSTTAFGAAASGKTAAATGLLGLTGKTGTTIVVWMLVGGAAGVAVTAPLSFLASRAPSTASSRQVTAPAERAPLGSIAPGARAAAPATVGPPEQSARGATAAPASARAGDATRSQVAKGVSQQDSVAPLREESSAPLGNVTTSVAENGAPSSAMATELMLLKSAQRELNAGNAEASLALLDEHARRYPGGALRVERLGARVFALCRLGHVDAARAAAGEFFATATDSPLVPRVVASCAGPGHRSAR
jgi:hypothetical protein